MSDLSITTAGMGGGVALGSLTRVASGSNVGGAVGAAAGLALGGLASHFVGKAIDDTPISDSGVLHPIVALSALGGAAGGVGLGAMALDSMTGGGIKKVPLAKTSALVGAWALAGAAVALTVATGAYASEYGKP